MSVARAYLPDTIVVDVHEGDMHVELVDDPGTWHRTAQGTPATACGLVIDYRLLLGQRPATYAGRLCPCCFTAYEMQLARKKEED